MHSRRYPIARALWACLVVTMTASSGLAQQGAEDGEWRHYGGDEANTRY